MYYFLHLTKSYPLLILLTFEKKRELILTRQGKIIRGKLTTTEMAKAEEDGRNGCSRGRDREGQTKANTEKEEGKGTQCFFMTERFDIISAHQNE